MKTIIESVKRTHRALIAHQAPFFMGLGAELAAQIQEKAFDYLDAPVSRVGAPYCTPPSSPILEKAFLPNEKDIISAVKKLV